MPIPLTGRARLAGAQSFCQLLLTMHASWLADALRPPSDRRIHRIPSNSTAYDFKRATHLQRYTQLHPIRVEMHRFQASKTRIHAICIHRAAPPQQHTPHRYHPPVPAVGGTLTCRRVP
ncbi:hypothetical protein D0A35_07720 [Xanthomonas campestris]|nr:hypothetical protein D0A35_07720 [Xanthomonas campestris]